jgi:dimethylhistidine N-methyltransferase
MTGFRMIGSSAGDGSRARAQFAADVRRGLTSTPKHLECRWFYDYEGSTLFEAICALPEYYIPRAETAILEAHAEMIAAELPPGATVVELGSGSSSKTRLVLDAFLRRAHGRVRYVPIDISAQMLEESGRALVAEYPRLDVTGVAGTYEEGLDELGRLGDEPRLVLWLGSNVGNFTRKAAGAFLGEVRRRLRPVDRMLLGVDLRKNPARLQLAYDDPAGVTARFNLNLLARINRELGGDFVVDGFSHRAVYEVEAGRIEIYIVARHAQEVTVRALDLTVQFAAGEAMHTEDSYKYAPHEIEALARAAGLRQVARWTDPEGLFASVLMGPTG